MRINLFVFGLVCVSLPVFAVAEEPLLSLDGKSFVGKLKAKNIWLRIGVKGSIHFESGQFYWTTGENDHDIQRGPYQIQQLGNQITFTARVPEATGSQDHVDWQGLYDGNTVSEVKAIWTRIEKDFVHDLMLPDQVILEFKQKVDR